MRQNRLRLGLRPTPRWGSLPNPVVGWGGETPFPFPSPQHIWRLDLAAFGGSLLDAFGVFILEPTFQKSWLRP